MGDHPLAAGGTDETQIAAIRERHEQVTEAQQERDSGHQVWADVYLSDVAFLLAALDTERAARETLAQQLSALTAQITPGAGYVARAYYLYVQPEVASVSRLIPIRIGPDEPATGPVLRSSRWRTAGPASGRRLALSRPAIASSRAG